MLHESLPIVGDFFLESVLELLAEQTVLIADAVTVQRDTDRSTRIHIAGGEPAQAAVAESRVFDFLEKGDVYTLFFEDLRYFLQYAEFQQIIIKYSADQKLYGKIRRATIRLFAYLYIFHCEQRYCVI